LARSPKSKVESPKWLAEIFARRENCERLAELVAVGSNDVFLHVHLLSGCRPLNSSRGVVVRLPPVT
jgi:hypothetical protein